MDVVKHGESAYPVNAWLEYQYSRNQEQGQTTGIGAREGFPANMSFPSLTEITGDLGTEERGSPDRESGDNSPGGTCNSV